MVKQGRRGNWPRKVSSLNTCVWQQMLEQQHSCVHHSDCLAVLFAYSSQLLSSPSENTSVRNNDNYLMCSFATSVCLGFLLHFHVCYWLTSMATGCHNDSGVFQQTNVLSSVLLALVYGKLGQIYWRTTLQRLHDSKLITSWCQIQPQHMSTGP